MLQSCRPTDRLGTTRETVAGNSSVVTERDLLEVDRRAHRIKCLVTLRAASRESVKRALAVWNRHNVTGLQVGVKHFTHHTCTKLDARSGLGSVRVLRFTGNNKPIILGIRGNNDRRNSVLGLIGCVLASTVKDLVNALHNAVDTIEPCADLAPTQDITRLLVLPVGIRSVERVIQQGRKVCTIDCRGQKGRGDKPKRAKARQSCCHQHTNQGPSDLKALRL